MSRGDSLPDLPKGAAGFMPAAPQTGGTPPTSDWSASELIPISRDGCIAVGEIGLGCRLAHGRATRRRRRRHMAVCICTEHSHDPVKFAGLGFGLFDSGVGLLDQSCVVLGHLVHLTYSHTHLFDGGGLLAAIAGHAFRDLG